MTRLTSSAITLILFCLLLTQADLAVAADSTSAGSASPLNSYISESDRLLTIKKIGVLPATDNVNGLYSRFAENKLSSLVKNSHRFNFVEIKEVDGSTTLDAYESKPQLIKDLGNKNGVDALVVERVYKTPQGLELTLDLFLTADGLLLAQETTNLENKFGTSDVEEKTGDLYAKIIDKIPYKGLVLSRQGNRVTLDVGTLDGIKDNIIVSIEQIISMKRHPKFHFLVGTEKEILGKIKIVKADETLSFGVVLSEKDRGIIATNSKVTGLDYVAYGDFSAPNNTDTSLKPATTGPDFPKNTVSFGKNPKEWQPPTQPTFGKLGMALGLGSFHNSQAYQNNTYSTDVAVYPQLELAGEIWLTTNWFVGASLEQGVMSVTNSGSGNSSSLGANNSHYDFQVGYHFLLQDDFWGPVLNLHTGIAKYSFFVDDSSPPSFTSMSYSGLYVGLGGSMPVTQDRRFYADLNVDRYLFPSLSESPTTSGASADPSVTRFSLGGSYRMNNQFWVKTHLSFESYTATFTGQGTRPGHDGAGQNASQTLTTLITGIDYYY